MNGTVRVRGWTVGAKVMLSGFDRPNRNVQPELRDEYAAHIQYLYPTNNAANNNAGQHSEYTVHVFFQLEKPVEHLPSLRHSGYMTFKFNDNNPSEWTASVGGVTCQATLSDDSD
jgi:hypothetical protein